MAPRVGLEPTTLRLTAACSTIELSGIEWAPKTTHERGQVKARNGGGRAAKAITAKTCVGRHFVDNYSAPCNEDTAAASPNKTCSSWKMKQDATYQLFLGEPLRIMIRKAIATWPSS